MHHASLDRHAGGDSPVHRLDARAKLLAALLYTAAVVSEPRTELLGLLPYVVPPSCLILLSQVPLGFVSRRVLALAPFALLMGVANLLYERAAVDVVLGPWRATVPLGLVTGAALLGKYLVSMLTLLALATTTPVHRLAGAMSALGMPRLLALQVASTHRYLFVVVGEAERRSRAAAARRVGPVAPARSLRAVGSSLSGLFVRSLHRSSRVAAAMAARGFDGTFPRPPDARWRGRDTLFLLVTSGLAAALRLRALVPGA